MKKHIQAVSLSAALTYLFVLVFYKIEMSNCVGCGIAPDGVTVLGLQFTDYLFNYLSLIAFIIIYLLIILSTKIFIKK